MSEHDFEPIRGLPGKLPPDERLLWQGAPDWLTLASQVFHVRAVAAYFAALLAWRLVEASAGGAPFGAVLLGAVGVVLIAAAGLCLLLGFAWLIARTTVYTITSKRVVMRFGIALPKAINIPYTIIDTAGLSVFGASARGNIALVLKKPAKIGYLQLWPHARPTKLANPEPTFRALANAKEAAGVLAGALLAHREQQASVPQSPLAAEPTPVPPQDQTQIPAAAAFAPMQISPA